MESALGLAFGECSGQRVGAQGVGKPRGHAWLRVREGFLEGETWQLRLSPGRRNGCGTSRNESVAEVRVDGEGRGEGVGEQEGLGPWEEWGLYRGYGRAFLGRGTGLHQGFRKTFGSCGGFVVGGSGGQGRSC